MYNYLENMIIIGGKKYTGGNMTIINGVVSNNIEDNEPKEYNCDNQIIEANHSLINGNGLVSWLCQKWMHERIHEWMKVTNEFMNQWIDQLSKPLVNEWINWVNTSLSNELSNQVANK